MAAKFLIRTFELHESSDTSLIISTDIISLLDSGVIRNIKVEIADSTTSLSWEDSSGDINSTPRLRKMYILLIASEETMLHDETDFA